MSNRFNLTRLPPSGYPSPDQAATIKGEHGNVHMFNNPVGGWFGFRTPKAEELTRWLLASQREKTDEGSAESERVAKLACVYPEDARVRFSQRPALAGRFAMDLLGAVGNNVGIQEILEDELSQEQGDMIVKLHERALALRVLVKDPIELIVREPSAAELPGLRKNLYNISAITDLFGELVALGDYDRIKREYPFLPFGLAVRTLNLSGSDEATEAKKL